MVDGLDLGDEAVEGERGVVDVDGAVGGGGEVVQDADDAFADGAESGETEGAVACGGIMSVQLNHTHCLEQGVAQQEGRTQVDLPPSIKRQ